TSERLTIGDVPFIIDGRKPKRNQALVYFREVVRLKNIQVNRFEKVQSVVKNNDVFTVTSDEDTYETPYENIATGYY
ncbi:NAD(P)-binding domain-containing protein, partial [Lysinibacillus fusiformis]|uniref:NAD(P)-binding domain-containing protein n=1 Tax=Lysinibacillus fusiformis TaxID=28031 RepID=UPI0020C1672B